MDKSAWNLQWKHPHWPYGMLIRNIYTHTLILITVFKTTDLKLGVIVHVYNLSTQEVEVRGLGFCGQSLIQSEF